MNSDYKKLSKFIAILLTLLLILIAFNSNEPIFRQLNNNNDNDMFSEFKNDSHDDYYEDEEEDLPTVFGKSYNAMRDDKLKEINKHIH